MKRTKLYNDKLKSQSFSWLKISVLVFFLIVTSGKIFSQEESSYILKRGDMLTITVMGHPEFSMDKILVMPDGYVQFPGLGSIQASSLSIKDFTKLVNDNIGKYVVNPVVTVFVSQLPSQIVNVVGYVNRPGQIIIFQPITIIEALSKAGGITNVKQCKTITIIRANQTFEVIKVKDLFSNANNDSKMKILNIGDTLYVVEPNQVNWSQLSFFTTLGWIVVSVLSLLKVVK
jgi:polysaccharide export outer membrane protein